jgi:UDP-glucose 4-epimerase
MSSHRTERVVVTGGAGFIGSHLVDRLLNTPQVEVVVLDNLSRGQLSNVAQHSAEPRLELIHGDIRDPDAVATAIRGASVVYHLAAQSTVMGGVTDAEYTFTTNTVGTFNVLRAAARYGVSRLIFASSREVYGEPIDLPVDEESPLLAINSYGASKIAGEAYCRAFRREFGLQTAILRLANVYGPRDVGRVIPLWVNQALDGHDLEVFGGKQVIDFVWVGQIVDALLRAAAFEGPLPIINVGSGTGTRIVDLARRILRLAERQGRLGLQPARPMEVTRYIAKVERMQQLLRIEPPLDPLVQLPTLFAARLGALS